MSEHSITSLIEKLEGADKMQAFSLDDFWSRYGRQEYETTDFAKALERLPSVAADGPWIAGGSVRRLVTRKAQESDFDFFFKGEVQFDAFCKAVEKAGGFRTNESDFNITFCIPAVKAKPLGDDEFSLGGPELKVQAIRIDYFESLNAVLESFDFSICQCGFDGSSLAFGPWTLWDLANNKLVPGKLRYGASSLRRVIKYTRQGFTICGGGLANMLEQVAADPSIIRGEVEYVD